MAIIRFGRRIPIRWENSAQELVWYQQHVRIDGKPISRDEMAAITGVRLRRLFQYEEATRNRSEKRRTGQRIDDPPMRTMRLVRLEFGIEEPLCKEYQPFQRSSHMAKTFGS